MFDPTIGDLRNKAFWLGATNAEGEYVSYQAYRVDQIDTNLAEWATGWMAGLYMKQQTLMVPQFIQPPENSRAERVRGKVVYHGEIWLDKRHRGQRLFETMPFLGMVLAYIKWYPTAMWGLVNDSMANRGYATRMRYPYLEHSFLRWSFHPDDVPSNEWLVLAERRDLDYLIHEFDLTAA